MPPFIHSSIHSFNMYWLAFTTGFLGSLHCVGMCGPIALALPLESKSTWAILQKAGLYNLGRTLMYVLLGLIIGIIGEGLGMAGLQKGLSIGIGILLLVVVFLSFNIEKWLINNRFFGQTFFIIKSKLAKWIRRPSAKAIFLTGFLNGLLPCGLVYIALAGALATGTIQGSISYMFLFGLGTIPLLLVTILVGNHSQFSLKRLLHKLYPAFLTLLGVWFIYRGIYLYLPDRVYMPEILSILPMCH